MKRQTIYVVLLGEGTDVWRPVEVEVLGGGLFRIISENANLEDEHWEFAPGSIVRGAQRASFDGPVVVALNA